MGARNLARTAFMLPVLLVMGAVLVRAEGAAVAAAPDGPVADRYLSWSIAAAEDGRWEEAERALERGGDFAESSSDLSYLLALVQSKLDRPLRSALSSVRQSLETGRWLRYSAPAARLLEAELLIGLREFEAAFQALAPLEEDATVAYLRLLSAEGLGDGRAFNSGAADFLAAWPFDARVPRLILERLADRPPGDAERMLVDAVLRRLDSLTEADPSLAYLAAPFVRDTASGRRLVEAYRAGSVVDAASIPVALNLGIMDDASAVEELFAAADKGPVDSALFVSVWKLLRNQAGKDAFTLRASLFSGTIFQDRDGDGRPETRVVYDGGLPSRCSYDADQDGLSELSIDFSDGMPVSGEIPLLPAISGEPGTEADRRLKIVWSRYPHIRTATLGSTRFIPAPVAFPFAPVRLSSLVAGLPTFRFPEFDRMVPRLTERSLVSFSSSIERRGTLRDDSIETIELVAGTPRRATERAGAELVASTVYERGRPVSRDLDLDGDGRLETRQRFSVRQTESSPLDQLPLPIFSESDWDGDGVYEYSEGSDGDGNALKTWRDDNGLRGQ